MKLPKTIGLVDLIIAAGLAVVLGLSGINHQPVLGIITVIAVEAVLWWRAGDLNLARVQADSWLWLSGISLVIVITLNPVLFTQVGLAIGFAGWRLWARQQLLEPRSPMIASAVSQGVMFWAVFLAAAVWHWPSIVTLGLVWSGSWLMGRRALAGNNDRAAEVLALTWALIVVECSWIFSLWLVNYIVFNGLLIIPQPALVLTALGYCMAGIYISHRRGQLSRARLVEYLMIGLLILVGVIAGTKWNGVI